MADPNTPVVPAAAAPPQPPPAVPATPPPAPAPVIPPGVLDEKTYLARAKAGLKVHTRTNYALRAYGSFDIVETTADSPGGAQILAVVRYVKTIDQKILDQVLPVLAAAQAKAAPAPAP